MNVTNPFLVLDERFNKLESFISDKLKTFEPKDSNAPIFISIAKACEITGLSKPTIYQYINDGIFEKYRIGSQTRLKLSQVIDSIKQVA